jgi:hypothetical protein
VLSFDQIDCWNGIAKAVLWIEDCSPGWFFRLGEIFSLFPATLTDTFGPKHAATNYGFLYIAHGVGSIMGGPAAAFSNRPPAVGLRCSSSLRC